MNWPPAHSSISSFCTSASGKSAGNFLQVEGSLAAVATLAPVIPMFPPIIFRRFGRRRSPRPKN